MWDVAGTRPQWQLMAPMPGAQIWLIQLPADGERVSDATKACLSEDEIKRAERFAQPHHAMRYVAAHAAARTLLGDLLGQKPEALTWWVQADGKPGLGGQELQFNLSHSGTWALLAIHPTLHVGVDLELHRPWEAMADLAREVLHPDEVALWERLPPAARAPALFTAWTRKEACLKALGTGLRTPPEEVHVGLAASPAQGRWVFRSQAPEPGAVHWQDLSLPLPEACSACLAWRHP